ncbi:aldo/keto reductase [Gloeocapsopsis dulcis]|uniref:Aldo/keto reductase n=1 Tax=Gloeocapsopsis dulcis AAB1 = 1H9 TaxID=1433147 RepID=A0A6N8FRK3_9CHRO|nr:aldo/keto reductase [Gloeocapsopsis dulcis]MUL35788.1 aldo/keto reductase [Gloeocapsopsis dulcis AAB1 = 1H9]WNN90928.1 aldo/keto reductase [Gloeocapsopsis dulcis]
MKITDLTAPTDDVIPVRKQFPNSDLPFYRPLGRTNLSVSCLGLGGGGQISSEDTLYAFDQGINFFFYSSDLHHYLYSSMAGALRQLCGRKSAVREQVVLATVSYIVKTPDAIFSSLYDQFVDLGIDYIDIFFWGWIGADNAGDLQNCLSASNDIRGPNTVCQRTMERIFSTSERLKKMGAVRYIGASFHDHHLARQWLNNPLLDVVMVRHNIAHRTAQQEVFTQLDPQDSQRSGIVTFKSAGMHNFLGDSPVNLPPGCWRPTVPDLYRYSLSQNCVDVCLTGLTRREEVDAAIANVQRGKLSAAELDYLALYGDLHRNRVKVQDVPAERWYQPPLPAAL